MFGIFRKVLSVTGLNKLMGEVVYEAPTVSGQSSSGYINCRVKILEEEGYLVGFEFKPDFYIGAIGSAKNYINFDMESAEKLRNHLDDCIEKIHQMQSEAET